MWHATAVRARRRGRAHLKVEGLSAGYGAFLVLRDLQPRGRARPHRDPRAQRRRQDHAAEGARRPDPAPRRGARSTARTLPRRRRTRSCSAGLALVRRGPAAVPADDGAREPRARRLAGRPGRARARAWSRPSTTFPKLRERAQPARRHDERRRAADGGGGARDDERAAPADARRAVARPGAAMVDELLAIARRIADAGTTVLMVEQNVQEGARGGRPRLRARARRAGRQRAGQAAGALDRRARGLPRRRRPPTPPPPPMRRNAARRRVATGS